MSMKPGATTSPLASIVRLRGASARLPMATIRPSRIPMSPEYQGEPVPSTICPLVMTMSSDCAGLAGTEASANRRINADFLRVILVLNRSEEHTSELQSRGHLVCRLLLEKKKRTPSVRHVQHIPS